MDRGSKQVFVQRTHIDGQQTNEQILTSLTINEIQIPVRITIIKNTRNNKLVNESD